MTCLDIKFDLLKPLNTNNLIRVGSKKDGGYVVDKNIILNTNQLISYGMGLDWSFEVEYLKLNKKGRVDIYDHTINAITFLRPCLKYLKRFLTFRLNYNDLIERFVQLKKYLDFVYNKNINFYKKKISTTKLSETIQVNQTFQKLEKNNKIIMKIDIEGDEYEIIDEVINNNKNIEMLIIEFHNLDINELKFISIIKKLNTYFYSIHIHGNNHCGFSESGLPVALEITFVNNKYKPTDIIFKKKFPNQELDFPNDPEKDDLFFSFK